MSKNNGGYAFPQPIAGDAEKGVMDTEDYSKENTGMSLRAWYAGQALNGLLSSWDDDKHGNFKTADVSSDVAALAFKIADAMIESLKTAEPTTDPP